MVNMNTTNDFRTVSYCGQTVTINKIWKTSDVVAFANSVADSCIIDGIYYPATFDYSFKYYLIAYTTDFVFPDDEDALEMAVMNSDLFTAMAYDVEWLIYMEDICRETIEEKLRSIERNSIAKIAEFGTSIVEMIDAFLSAAQNWKIPENFGETLMEIQALAHDPHKVAEIYSMAQEYKDADSDG